AVFGKTKAPVGLEKLLLIEQPAKDQNVTIDTTEYSKIKEWKWDLENKKYDFISLFGAAAIKLDSSQVYSPTIEKQYSEITTKDYAKLRIKLRIYCTTEIKDNPGSLVVSFEHKGYAYGYAATDLEKSTIELNKWVEVYP